MTEARRIPPPWTADRIEGGYVILFAVGEV